MTVYECQLFTWPYITKNNADIELLWLKVCRAVLKKLSRVPGAWNFCRVVPPGAVTSLTLTLMRTVWKIVLLWIITLLNMSLYYIVSCCTTVLYLKRDDTRHYATLWEVTLHFKMLRSDINFSFSQTSTHVSRTVWKHGKCFVFLKHILVNKFCKCTFVFFFEPLS